MSPSEDRVLTRPILAELLKMETARTPESEPGPQVSDMSFSGNRVPTQLPGLTKTYFDEWDPLPDPLPTDDNSLDEDAPFDAACDTNFTHVDDDESRCRTRDIRRLLLDERLHRLRRIVFREKDASDGEIKRRDPHVLRHIWTAAVRRRGWKLLENLTPPTNGIRYKLRWNPVNLSQPVPAWMLGNGTQLLHEAVLYRDLADE